MRSGKLSDPESSNSQQRGITNNLTKKAEEYIEKTPKPDQSEWTVVTEKKKSCNEQEPEQVNLNKSNVQKASPLDTINQLKEPEKIQMRIQVLDKEVNFEYNLKKDTP